MVPNNNSFRCYIEVYDCVRKINLLISFNNHCIIYPTDCYVLSFEYKLTVKNAKYDNGTYVCLDELGYHLIINNQNITTLLQLCQHI